MRDCVKPSGVGTQRSTGRSIAGASPIDVNFYEDVFWALLNTNEFMLNH